jgi:sortase A
MNRTRLAMACLAVGTALTVLYGIARLDAAISGQRAIARFTPNTSLWSASRVRAYRLSINPSEDALLGVLQIRALEIEAPVYADTRELYLNRGVGLIPRTAPPGVRGNLGIAGHRDGFFRALKDIEVGDVVELTTRDRRFRYRVFAISVVDRHDARLLQATPQPLLTLVTCHPFYYLGRAPERFVVRSQLVSSHGRPI